MIANPNPSGTQIRGKLDELSSRKERATICKRRKHQRQHAHARQGRDWRGKAKDHHLVCCRCKRLDTRR